MPDASASPGTGPEPLGPSGDEGWDALRAAIPDTFPEPWRTSLDRALEQLPEADPLYRPTNFWQPGVEALLGDLRDRGIESFKSWPSSAYFFYPRYTPVFSNAMVEKAMPVLQELAPNTYPSWFHSRLVSAVDARRDVDVALALLDTEKFPLDVGSHGESPVGEPPQRYRLFAADGPTYGKPYLNYLLLMSALSRHLDRPVRSVLEIGAGCGVLGELLWHADPTIQYVDLDIPPLSVIAHHYLSTVFPDRDLASNLDVAESKGLTLEPGGRSACLSSWQVEDLDGEADLFLNAFSFQEMEPDVVANYAAQVARLGARHVVSLNSRAGKPLAAESEVGVVQQVTSDFIHDTFVSLGYSTVARIGRPVAPPQAELLILRRDEA